MLLVLCCRNNSIEGKYGGETGHDSTADDWPLTTDH
jgi:hypothetical protein